MNKKRNEVKDALKVLKKHPFTLMQLSDKEKFHTGLLAYTLNTYPKLFSNIFELEKNKNYKAFVEKWSTDLIVVNYSIDAAEPEYDTIKKEDVVAVVEVKFKTGLHRSKNPDYTKESGEQEYIPQLKKIHDYTFKDRKINFALISLFPIEYDGFRSLQFTNDEVFKNEVLLLKEIKEVVEDNEPILKAWIGYLEHLQVIVKYIIEKKLGEIEVEKIESDLKTIKLKGIFERYRYNLVREEVNKIAGEDLKDQLFNNTGLDEIGELGNTHGNGLVTYRLKTKKKAIEYGIQWQSGNLKLFIETNKELTEENRDRNLEELYSHLVQKLNAIKETNNLNRKGKFRSITIKKWNIFDNVSDHHTQILEYLNVLNQTDARKIVSQKKTK